MRNFIRTTVVTAAMLVAAQTASAISVDFKFKVNSSGASIYPCNAGIHTPKSNKHVCYFEGTKEPCQQTCVGDHCTPTPSGQPGFASLFSLPTPPPPPDCHDGKCAPPPNHNPRACVCTTENGESYANYLNGSYGFWGETGDPQRLVSAQPGDDSHWQTLFTEKDAYGKVLDHLTVNLGNELYNAAYFVDVCYRGPQIDYRGLETTWDILGKVSVTDFGYGAAVHDGYSKLSNLKVKAHLICTLQDGTKDYEDDINLDPATQGPLFLSDFPEKKDSNDVDLLTSSVPVSSSLVEILHLNQKFEKNRCSSAPKFCKIRYVFEETDAYSRYPNFRKWQKHGAQICTYSQVEPTSIEKGADYKP